MGALLVWHLDEQACADELNVYGGVGIDLVSVERAMGCMLASRRWEEESSCWSSKSSSTGEAQLGGSWPVAAPLISRDLKRYTVPLSDCMTFCNLDCKLLNATFHHRSFDWSRPSTLG